MCALQRPYAKDYFRNTTQQARGRPYNTGNYREVNSQALMGTHRSTEKKWIIVHPRTKVKNKEGVGSVKFSGEKTQFPSQKHLNFIDSMRNVIVI